MWDLRHRIDLRPSLEYAINAKPQAIQLNFMFPNETNDRCKYIASRTCLRARQTDKRTFERGPRNEQIIMLFLNYIYTKRKTNNGPTNDIVMEMMRGDKWKQTQTTENHLRWSGRFAAHFITSMFEIRCPVRRLKFDSIGFGANGNCSRRIDTTFAIA